MPTGAYTADDIAPDSPHYTAADIASPATPQAATLPTAGARLFGNTPIMDTLSTVGSHLKNLVEAPYHAFADPATPQEVKDITAGGGTPDAIGRGLYRMAVKPTVEGIRTFQQQRAAGNTSMTAPEYDAQGNYTPTAGSGLVDAIPIVGPFARGIENEAHTKGALPALAGAATDVGAAALAGKVATKALTPSLTPLTTPLEATARDAAANIGVPNAPKFEESLGVVGPDIKRFAREQGHPIDSGTSVFDRNPNAIRDFSKIADEYGDTLANLYDTLLDNADKGGAVNIGGGGPTKYASVRELDSYARDLNKKVNGAYAISKYGDRMAALQKLEESGILGEQSRVGDLLNKTVADRNGLQAPEVQSFRQHIAKVRDVADQVNAADQAISGRVGAQERGTNPATGVGYGPMATAARIGGKILKGDERVAAGRHLAQTLGKLPEANTPLPQPQPVTPTRPAPRRSVPQGLTPLDTGTSYPPPNPADIAAQAATRAQNLSRYQSTQAATQAATAAEAARQAANRATAGTRLQNLTPLEPK